MKPCPHEAEVQAILRRGHWPEACNPEFRNHVETCRTCGEQLLVLHAFHTARAQAIQTARLDHPNLIWWRAQLRRRNEALHRVSKPIATAQIFALCVGILAVAGLLVSQIRRGVNWSAWLPQSSSASHLDALSFFTSIASDWGLFTLLAGLGTLALLSVVVLYLVTGPKIDPK
jgi:hypothetical protein